MHYGIGTRYIKPVLLECGYDVAMVAAIMTALCIACGEHTKPKHKSQFQHGFYRTIASKDPSAKSFYRASSGRENQKEYSMYIE